MGKRLEGGKGMHLQVTTHETYAEVTLTCGKVVKVSLNDAEFVASRGWLVPASVGYVMSTRKPRQMLHRLLVNAPTDKEVDHINHDRLDNRRENLRLCSRAENARNRRVQASKMKGVHKNGCGTWSAAILVDGRLQHLGTFGTPEEAAAAYDAVARAHYGEFACTNAPGEARMTVEEARKGVRRMGGVERYHGVQTQAPEKSGRGLRWRAYVYVKGRSVPVGYFRSAEDAAWARDVVTRWLGGTDRMYNFPEETTALSLEEVRALRAERYAGGLPLWEGKRLGEEGPG